MHRKLFLSLAVSGRALAQTITPAPTATGLAGLESSGLAQLSTFVSGAWAGWVSELSALVSDIPPGARVSDIPAFVDLLGPQITAVESSVAALFSSDAALAHAPSDIQSAAPALATALVVDGVPIFESFVSAHLPATLLLADLPAALSTRLSEVLSDLPALASQVLSAAASDITPISSDLATWLPAALSTLAGDAKDGPSNGTATVSASTGAASPLVRGSITPAVAPSGSTSAPASSTTNAANGLVWGGEMMGLVAAVVGVALL